MWKFYNLGTILSYYVGLKLTDGFVKICGFIIISTFLFTYLASSVQYLMDFFEDFLPAQIFAVCVYFGVVDFLRIFLSLSVQSILVNYFFTYFTYHSPR